MTGILVGPCPQSNQAYPTHLDRVRAVRIYARPTHYPPDKPLSSLAHLKTGGGDAV